jgi:hypothetical protein
MLTTIRRFPMFVLLLLLLLAAPANAVNYYLSPTGADTNAGTSTSSAWKTFGHALPRLEPGDTLLLLDGTYTAPTTGLPYLNCGGQSRVDPSGRKPVRGRGGTASQAIVLKAVNERRAHLQGDGRNVVQFDFCTHWILDGLYVSNQDSAVSGYEGSGIVLQNVSHFIVRRSLVYGPNAYFNSHGIALYATHHSVVEENEVYYATRHGIILGDSVTPSDGNIVRRNYVHSRNHGSMSGGYTCAGSCENHRGDEGISCYPCKNTLIENNIAEAFDGSYTIQGKMQPFGNRYFGNVALNGGGFSANARPEMVPNSADQMPTNTVYENNVAYHVDVWAGFTCRVCKNTQMVNNTVLATTTAVPPLGLNWDTSCGTSCGEGGDGQLSNYATNTLILHAKGPAVSVAGVPQWGVDYLSTWGNTGSAPAFSDPHYSHVQTTDPHMGACVVYLPATSPARGAGKDGANLGAEILNRYQDGILTDVPLWNPQTGQFPCGAIVAGVNDVAGSSCINVHERLHVGTADCPLPSTPPVPPDRPVRPTSMACTGEITAVPGPIALVCQPQEGRK